MEEPKDLTTKPLIARPIPRTPVESSMLFSVGYEPNGSILAVQFRDRSGNPTRVYEYEGVPEWIYQEIVDPLATRSRGEFFDRVVKKGPYTGYRVEEEESSGREMM